MKRTTGHLAEKNNKWYAVINLYDANGKRKEKWTSINLEVKRGTKTEANHRLQEILTRYNSGEFYLLESLPKAEQARRKIADKAVEDYLEEWLDEYKNNIAPTTYRSYNYIIHNSMVPYFKKLHLTLKEVTGDELNDYYNYLINSGAKNATAQRHHSLLHRAFKQAVKRRIIPSNPCDQAERPKADQYIGDYYKEADLKKLLANLENDPLRIVIVLAAYYGLRRSEVIGLKWDAIDFEANTISIRHKVVDVNNTLLGLDVMKTKSSYRTLPLIPSVAEELKKEKEKQNKMMLAFKRAYCKKYTDYICVDASGELIKPQYVTEHFKVLLRHIGMRIIRFHDLRHSCASLLLANGVPMKLIQEWLGHSNMSTTANFYSHTDSNSKLVSAKTIGDILS